MPNLRLPPGTGKDLVELAKKYLQKTAPKAGKAAEDAIEAEYRVLPQAAQQAPQLLLPPGQASVPNPSNLAKGVVGTAAGGYLLNKLFGGQEAPQGSNEILPGPGLLEQRAKEETPSLLGKFASRPIISGEEERDVNKEVAETEPKTVAREAKQKAADKLPEDMPSRDIASENAVDFGQNNTNNTVANLQKAQQLEQNSIYGAQMAKAGDLIGASLARATPLAQDALDKQIEQAHNITKNFQARVEQEKNDPNSAFSMGFGNYLKQLGVPVKGNFSAAAGEKLLPLAYRQYEAKLETANKRDIAEENRKSREFLAQENAKERGFARQEHRMEKEEQRGQMQSNKNRQFVQSFRKELASGPIAKTYNNYLNSERAGSSIESFMKHPTGYSDYATMMGGLKALQGDESVVREAEIRLGMDAGSFKDKVLNRIEKLQSGKSLQPEQRQAIVEAVKVLQDVTKKQYLDSVEPHLQNAQEENIPFKNILPKSMLAAANQRFGLESEPERNQATLIRKGYNSKTDETQLVYSDGSKKIVKGKQ